MTLKDYWVAITSNDMWWVPTYREMLVPAACVVTAFGLGLMAVLTVAPGLALLAMVTASIGLVWMALDIKTKAAAVHAARLAPFRTKD